MTVREHLRTILLSPVLALLLLSSCGLRSEQDTARVRPGNVGQKAPDFTLQKSDGDTFTLNTFKGKKIVVMGVGNPFG